MSASKEYTNGEITIVWKPGLCTHSGICVKGLPGVFNPKERPWIKIDKAETQQLAEQVKQCPSGALSYYMNDSKKSNTQEKKSMDKTTIKVMKGGPLLVNGSLAITHTDDSAEEREKPTAFCRCGQTQNRPFCDGSHKQLTDFE